MTSFEVYCDKWECHNAAINAESFTLESFPTVRVKADNKSYIIGTTLHKWKMEPSGSALAIITFGKALSEDHAFWNEPHNNRMNDEEIEITSIIDKIKGQSIEQLVVDIEDGKSSLDNLHIFKYHANQWREIIKPKSKWTYKTKAEKCDTCNVQRLLDF